MSLGELAADHGRTVLAVGGGELGQRLRQPAAGLEVDLGAAVAGQLGEAPGPLALAARRKPLEAEPVGGQPGDGQRGRHRRRTRQGGHPQAGRGRSGDEPVAGITDPRGTRVGDEQDVPACLQLAEQVDRAARLHGVVVGDDAGLELDVQARRQPAHAARVLRRDEGGLGEFGRQPPGRVLGPADRDRRQRQHAAALVRFSLVRLARAPRLAWSPSLVRLSLVGLTRCRACHGSRHVPIAPRPPHWISHITIRLAGLYRRQ